MTASASELLPVLDRLGVATGPQLMASLEISAPTLSRLVARVPDEVCRLGKTRGALYARRRSLRDLGSRLPLHIVDESGMLHRHGTLHLLAGEGCWLERSRGAGQRFEGQPPFVADMSPQGFLGRSFATRHRDLLLPPRAGDWSTDHRLIALARRGEDCVGHWIIGNESVDRWLATKMTSVSTRAYPGLARAALQGEVGSSAGGEQPKFLAYAKDRHALVKFAGDGPGPAARRWRDLLVCEAIAHEVLASSDVPGCHARSFELEGMHFLEVERFDRVGPRGRLGVASLMAIDNELYGQLDNWTQAARRLERDRLLSHGDARRLCWLDVFGQLIGNTDRHFGNASFFVADDGALTLAPAYDMLPMFAAPLEGNLVERRYEPAPPTSETLEVWHDAAIHAERFWLLCAASHELHAELRALCRRCGDRLATLRAQMPQAG